MRYWIKTFIYAMLSPLIVSVVTIVFLSPFMLNIGTAGDIVPSVLFLSVIVGMNFLFGRWKKYVLKNELPKDPFVRFSPVLAVFVYYMLVWIVMFGAAEFRSIGDRFGSPDFLKLMFPFSVIAVVFDGNLEYVAWFPYVIFFTYLPIVYALALAKRLRAKSPAAKAGAAAMIVITVGLCATAVGMDVKHRALVAELRANVVRTFRNAPERVDAEVDPQLYYPFQEKSLLRSLDETPTLVIASDYPRLDGATSALPIYCAVAETLYEGLDGKTAGNYVYSSRTAQAYGRLIKGEADIFFGLQPSPQQAEAAKENSVELIATPIARDGFVFFVNRENPVDSLTLGQIRDIYMNKITSWEAVGANSERWEVFGGNSERILPFQRQEGSGSQTIMTALVMEGLRLPPPLVGQVHRGMGNIIAKVAADYHNYSTALGYSFFHYATEMNPHEGIKLLAIDGVAPTRENIRNGTYPLIVPVYTVTTDQAEQGNANVRKLIDWCLSDQGQRLIERSGYVGL